MADKTVADKTSVVYRNVRPAGTGVCAALVVFFAGCGEEPTVPLDSGAEPVAPQAAFSVRIDCAVDIGKGGDLECEPAGGMNGESSGGPSHNLVVGSQHRYVRMANDAPVMDATTWSANVTVQNLTLQPFGTLDGTTADAAGVRVFFVEEPNNGVEVDNADGADTFIEAAPRPYYAYGGADLGGDGILSQGEVSAGKEWKFVLNGATTFRFSVLVSTTVPDPGAYSVHLTRIDGEGSHTCGDGADGRIYCWGSNDFGQLGDGTTTDRWTPVAVQAPPGVTLRNVAVGDNSTCAEGDDDELYCWGYNGYGQLGDGTDQDRPYPGVVTRPNGTVRLSGVTASNMHTCANGDDGNVYCWGNNWDGQVGDGTTEYTRSTPVRVVSPVGLSNVVAAYNHSCAEGADGVLYCWGNNWRGQLGNGTTETSRTPVAVLAPPGVTLKDAALGYTFSCALSDAGPVYCWGVNWEGEVGDGTDVQRNSPVLVAGTRGP